MAGGEREASRDGNVTAPLPSLAPFARSADSRSLVARCVVVKGLHCLLGRYPGAAPLLPDEYDANSEEGRNPLYRIAGRCGTATHTHRHSPASRVGWATAPPDAKHTAAPNAKHAVAARSWQGREG